MRIFAKGRRPYRFALASLLTLAVLLLHRADAFNDLEIQALDLRFSVRGPLSPGPEIVLVLVDDRTIAELGEWPLSRLYFARAVQTLKAAGAKTIAFNLLFANPSEMLTERAQSSIEQVRDRLEARQAEEAALLGEILSLDADRELEKSVRDAGNVLMPFAFVFDRSQRNVDLLPEYVERAAVSQYRILPGGRQPTLAPAGVLAALSPLGSAAVAAGHVTLVFDPDGTPRYEHPVIAYEGEYFPSLPIAAYRRFVGLDRSEMTAVIPEGIEIGDRFVPTDTNMRLIVNYYGPSGTFPTYSLADVIEDRIDGNPFRDKLVLIGGTALGISDSYPSPFTQGLPGVERYATVIDNILHGRRLERGVRSGFIEVEAILFGGLAAFLAATLLPVPWAIACALGLVGVWTATSFVAFARLDLWINYTSPLIAIALNFVIFLAARVFTEERRRRRAEQQRANLGRYFSPNIVEKLAHGGTAQSLDRVIDAAVMFVDIIGFTRLSERMAPADAIALLREFHGCVERAVFAHAGTLDKFLGDGAMATFGPPDPRPEDAVNALACARALADDVEQLSRRLVEAGRPALRIGIGLHYGPVLMGNVGGEQRFEFTVIGDTVNVASRLESLTRTANARIIASDALVAAARRTPAGAELAANLEALPAQRLRGRDEEILAWSFDATDARTT